LNDDAGLGWRVLMFLGPFCMAHSFWSLSGECLRW
jgi:hypothetical protein